MFGFFRKKQASIPHGLPEGMELIRLRAFPDGDDQRDIETTSLHSALNGTLTREEAGSLLSWTKVLLVLSEDLSLDCISEGIYGHEQGRLTRCDSEIVYRHITGVKDAIYSGGNGLHADDPVVINCSLTTVGQWAERKWLRDNIGEEDTEWTLSSRAHGRGDDGSAVETFVVTMASGEEVRIHFDISQWYLKN